MYENEVVKEIKKFVESHLQEEITLKKVSDAICYSEEHTSRLFKKQSGENLFDFIRNQRLLKAAEQIKVKGGKIINVAFDFGFNSHEVFTRAFSNYFGISPGRFRILKPEIKHFMPKGLKVFPLEYKEDYMNNFLIYTQIMEKGERDFLFYPGKKATHYFEYCEEFKCDIWGKLLEIDDTLNEPMGVWLPAKYRKDSCSKYVQGVEVSVNYEKNLPEDIQRIRLPANIYMIFQSQPYQESDENMFEAIQSVQSAIEKYNPKLYGYEWAKEDAPRYQLCPIGERGYIEAIPVRKIKN